MGWARGEWATIMLVALLGLACVHGNTLTVPADDVLLEVQAKTMFAQDVLGVLQSVKEVIDTLKDTKFRLTEVRELFTKVSARVEDMKYDPIKLLNQDVANSVVEVLLDLRTVLASLDIAHGSEVDSYKNVFKNYGQVLELDALKTKLARTSDFMRIETQVLQGYVLGLSDAQSSHSLNSLISDWGARDSTPARDAASILETARSLNPQAFDTEKTVTERYSVDENVERVRSKASVAALLACKSREDIIGLSTHLAKFDGNKVKQALSKIGKDKNPLVLVDRMLVILDCAMSSNLRLLASIVGRRGHPPPLMSTFASIRTMLNAETVSVPDMSAVDEYTAALFEQARTLSTALKTDLRLDRVRPMFTTDAGIESLLQGFKLPESSFGLTNEFITKFREFGAEWANIFAHLNQAVPAAEVAMNRARSLRQSYVSNKARCREVFDSARTACTAHQRTAARKCSTTMSFLEEEARVVLSMAVEELRHRQLMVTETRTQRKRDFKKFKLIKKDPTPLDFSIKEQLDLIKDALSPEGFAARLRESLTRDRQCRSDGGISPFMAELEKATATGVPGADNYVHPLRYVNNKVSPNLKDYCLYHKWEPLLSNRVAGTSEHMPVGDESPHQAYGDTMHTYLDLYPLHGRLGLWGTCLPSVHLASKVVLEMLQHVMKEHTFGLNELVVTAEAKATLKSNLLGLLLNIGTLNNCLVPQVGTAMGGQGGFQNARQKEAMFNRLAPQRFLDPLHFAELSHLHFGLIANNVNVNLAGDDSEDTGARMTPEDVGVYALVREERLAAATPGQKPDSGVPVKEIGAYFDNIAAVMADEANFKTKKSRWPVLKKLWEDLLNHRQVLDPLDENRMVLRARIQTLVSTQDPAGFHVHAGLSRVEECAQAATTADRECEALGESLGGVCEGNAWADHAKVWMEQHPDELTKVWASDETGVTDRDGLGAAASSDAVAIVHQILRGCGLSVDQEFFIDPVLCDPSQVNLVFSPRYEPSRDKPRPSYASMPTRSPGTTNFGSFDRE